MAAASDIDLGDLLALSEDFEDFQKPKPPASTSKPESDKPLATKPQDEKPQESDPKPSPKPGEPVAQDVAPKSDLKVEKKEVNKRKHEKAQR